MGAEAWPGDAAELLTSGETSAEQIPQLQRAAHTPAPLVFTRALRSVLQPRNAPILFLLISLGPAREVGNKISQMPWQ